jgi:hypothetical protein
MRREAAPADRRDARSQPTVQQPSDDGSPLAPTHEPFAVLGIGAMGGGMATSAWRAGIPIIVWNRSQQCRVPGDGTERIAVGHH